MTGSPVTHSGAGHSVSQREIGVIGAGYVGLTVAACFAHLGHRVRCCEVDDARLAMLSGGELPMVEPRLTDMVAEGIGLGRLTFTGNVAEAAAPSEFVFVAVPTPLGADDEIDMSAVLDAAVTAASAMKPSGVLVIKSTMPVGGAARVGAALRDAGIDVEAATGVGPQLGPQIGLVSNPEFVSEASAVDDFLKPDRVVLGGGPESVLGGGPESVLGGSATDAVAELYRPLGAAVHVMDHASAEMVKCASNSFLAAKVSFVNALAAACEAVGADIDAVLAGVGADPRIGGTYLQPGPGWGGSCLPKDTRALWRTAGDAGYMFDLLAAVMEVNDQQPRRVVSKVAALAPSSQLDGVAVALLGLAFKAGTDDTRGSPALAVAQLLADEGAVLTCYDPAVAEPLALTGSVPGALVPSADAYEALADAHVAVVLTEWSDFAELDWRRVAQVMAQPAIVDARNLLDPAVMHAAGFRYVGMGRTGWHAAGRADADRGSSCA